MCFYNLNNKNMNKYYVLTAAVICSINFYVNHSLRKEWLKAKQPPTEAVEHFKPTAELVDVEDLSNINPSETAYHETAHYIIHIKACAAYHEIAYPVRVTIEKRGDTLGGFKRKTNPSRPQSAQVKILTALAGYASQCVFGGGNPKTVFNGMVDTPDFAAAAKVRPITFDDFLKTVEWVSTYRKEIVNFARRLEKEKTIVFQ